MSGFDKRSGAHGGSDEDESNIKIGTSGLGWIRVGFFAQWVSETTTAEASLVNLHGGSAKQQMRRWRSTHAATTARERCDGEGRKGLTLTRR